MSATKLAFAVVIAALAAAGVRGQPKAPQSSPGQSWICSPLEATVISGRNGMHQRCPVTAIHQLTPAEAAALPKRDRP